MESHLLPIFTDVPPYFKLIGFVINIIQITGLMSKYWMMLTVSEPNQSIEQLLYIQA